MSAAEAAPAALLEDLQALRGELEAELRARAADVQATQGVSYLLLSGFLVFFMQVRLLSAAPPLPSRLDGRPPLRSAAYPYAC